MDTAPIEQITNQNPPMPVNEPVVKPVFHFHTLPVLIYTLLIILLTSGAFLLGQKYSAPKETAIQPVVSVPTIAPTAFPATDPTADWKQLENNLDYIIKIPPPQHCNGCYDGLKGVEGVYAYGVESIGDFNSDRDNWFFQIVKINKDKLPLRNGIQNLGVDYFEKLSLLKIGETTQINDQKIGNYEIKRLPDSLVNNITFNIFETGLSSQQNKTIKIGYTIKGNDFYWVTFEWTNPKYNSVFDQILSTFKFTK